MKHIAILILITFVVACSGNNDNSLTKKTDPASITPDKIAEVTVMQLKPTVFNHEIINNGRLTAREKVDVAFPSSGLLSEVCVKNGQRVNKGQKLASLDVFRLNNRLEKDRNAVEAARLDMQDVIISQGYDPQNKAAIPDDVMRLARLRSGLEQAELTLDATRRDIADATLTAPISGVVANLTAKAGAMTGTEPLCRIINDRTMDVMFSILESELSMVKPGDKVEVTPFSGSGTYNGHITEINPMVDDNGLVKIFASVDDNDRLLDGMNVRVSVKRSIGEALVVPKSAVVLRSGRQVVFTLDGDKAVWHYVTTGLENINEYTITEGLEPDMNVIVSGNVNLAHESPVKVIR